LQYEVRRQGDVVLLHLWSSERTLVLRVRELVADEPGRLELAATRFGRARPDRLEFVAHDANDNAKPAAARLAREQFRERFTELLAQQFPDEKLVSLTTAPDLKHSLSSSHARGILTAGTRTWAVLGTAPGETAATYDAVLTFGLLWLDRARESARRKIVAGLRLFVPAGAARITAHRLQALSPSTAVELYEYDIENWRARRVDPSDSGNQETWLVPRRESEAILAEAQPAIQRIQRLAPGIIEAAVIPGTREVALRFRGLLFARWTREGVFYGGGDAQKPLLPERQADFERLVRELGKHRSGASSPEGARHPLYRAQAERWLESLVAADPGRIDARLDPRFLYTQVPALSEGERSVMDLMGMTRGGRLAAGGGGTQGERRSATADAGCRLLAARALASCAGRLHPVRVFSGRHAGPAGSAAVSGRAGDSFSFRHRHSVALSGQRDRNLPGGRQRNVAARVEGGFAAKLI
jgi:hypothetical protein